MLLTALMSATGILPVPVNLTLGTGNSDESFPMHVQLGQSPSGDKNINYKLADQIHFKTKMSLHQCDQMLE